MTWLLDHMGTHWIEGWLLSETQLLVPLWWHSAFCLIQESTNL